MTSSPDFSTAFAARAANRSVQVRSMDILNEEGEKTGRQGYCFAQEEPLTLELIALAVETQTPLRIVFASLSSPEAAIADPKLGQVAVTVRESPYGGWVIDPHVRKLGA